MHWMHSTVCVVHQNRNLEMVQVQMQTCCTSIHHLEKCQIQYPRMEPRKNTPCVYLQYDDTYETREMSHSHLKIVEGDELPCECAQK